MRNLYLSSKRHSQTICCSLIWCKWLNEKFVAHFFQPKLCQTVLNVPDDIEAGGGREAICPEVYWGGWEAALGPQIWWFSDCWNGFWAIKRVFFCTEIHLICHETQFSQTPVGLCQLVKKPVKYILGSKDSKRNFFYKEIGENRYYNIFWNEKNLLHPNIDS